MGRKNYWLFAKEIATEDACELGFTTPGFAQDGDDFASTEIHEHIIDLLELFLRKNIPFFDRLLDEAKEPKIFRVGLDVSMDDGPIKSRIDAEVII